MWKDPQGRCLPSARFFRPKCGNGPLELARVFDGHHVADVFHHANDADVAVRVGANVADVAVNRLWQMRQVLDSRRRRIKLPEKGIHAAFVLFEQVQHQPEGRFFADAGQRGKLIDGRLEQFR